MNPYQALVQKIRSSAPAILAVTVLAIAWMLLPPAAEACCTAVLCPYCVSGRSDCPCAMAEGYTQPVCNMAACNCNVQCGEWTWSTSGTCYYSPTCNSAEAKEMAQKRFDEIDANRDGKIAKGEIKSWLQKQKTPWIQRVKKEDLPAELQKAGASEDAVLGHEFDRMDTNKDGFVQPGELDSSLSAPAPKGS